MATLTDQEIRILKRFVVEIKNVGQEIKKEGSVKDVSIGSMIKNAIKEE